MNAVALSPAFLPHILLAHSTPLLNAGMAVQLRATGKYRVTMAAPGTHWPQADMIVTCELGARAGAGAGTAPILVLGRQPKDETLGTLLRQRVKGFLLLECPAEEFCRALEYVLRGDSYMCPQLLGRMLKTPLPAQLTQREADVLRVLALGHGNKAIARCLDIGEDTVKTHMKHLMSKLGASSRTQALALAAQRGLVDIDAATV